MLAFAVGGGRKTKRGGGGRRKVRRLLVIGRGREVGTGRVRRRETDMEMVWELEWKWLLLWKGKQFVINYHVMVDKCNAIKVTLN